MGVFRQMANASFRVTDRGETLFHSPLFFFWDRRAYVMRSSDDVERLKRSLARSNWVLFVFVIPVMVLAFDRVFGRSEFVVTGLSALAVGAFAGLTIRFLVIRRAVGDLDRSSNETGFLESLENQAASFDGKTLLFFASVGLAMIALGIFSLSSGGTAPGICLVVLGGWIGLHHAYLMSLRRRRVDRKSRAP